MLPHVAQELKDSGLAVESSGALCLFVPNYKVPLMVMKSDGGYGYDSTDLAAVKYRLIEMKADWVLYVVDMGQEEHFLKSFYAAKAAGWNKENEKKRLEFIGFGIVLGEDKKRFRTRSGDVVKLTALLDEAADRAYIELKNRYTQNNNTTEQSDVDVPQEESLSSKSDEELKKMGEMIGYNAVKYFELKQNRLTSYQFSYDKILDPKGNTAVYMLYAYARICSIFRKGNISKKELDPSDLKIENKEERALALAILKFPEILQFILRDFFVNNLSEYMYNLTDLFSQFYEQHKILNTSQQNSRLVLCETTRYVLHLCFNLLGIEPLQQI